MVNRKAHDGSGSVRRKRPGLFELRYYTPDGKRKSVYGSSEKDVRTKLQALLRQQEQGRNLSLKRERLRDYLDRWLQTKSTQIARSTHVRYECVVRTHIVPTIGTKFLDALTPQVIQDWVDRKAESDLSPLTVGYIRSVLRSALSDAERLGLVSYNAAKRVTVPRQEGRKFVALDPEESRRLLDASKEDNLGPLIAVALHTGARQGELLGLSWGDIDLDGATITIRGSLKNVGGVRTVGRAKTPASHRTIPLSSGAVAAFRRQRARQAELRLAADRWANGELVFTNGRGEPLNGILVTKRLQLILADTGLRRIRFHDLRHSAASLMLAGGVPISTVSSILGHTGIAITMKHYAHLYPEVKREAATALDRMLG